MAQPVPDPSRAVRRPRAGGWEHVGVSQQTVIDELQRLGMTGYEAKAYSALVAAGGPLSGYEVAKRSGVPRSTVYETISKLANRGAAYEVRTGEDVVSYIALPPTALLDRLGREFDASIDTLREALPRLAAPTHVRMMHDLPDRSSLLARAEDVVTAARTDLFVSGFPEEIEALKPVIRQAEHAGVDVTAVVFGEDDDPVGRTFTHRFSAPEVVLENLGCRLLVLVADRDQAVIGGAVEAEGWGAYTDDPAVVLVAVEYVRHDIALHLIAERFATADEFDIFWNSDPTLRGFRSDHGAPAALLKRIGVGGKQTRPVRGRRRREPRIS